MEEIDGFAVYAGQYDTLEDARDDFQMIKSLHKHKFIGHYESALFERHELGKVKIVDTDETVRAHNAVAGAIVGGLFGVLWPPMLVLAGVGASLGALIGHVAVGIPRRDVKDLGEMLDEGHAGIILVAETTLEEGAERIMKRASRVMQKEIKADVREMKRAVDEAAKAA